MYPNYVLAKMIKGIDDTSPKIEYDLNLSSPLSVFSSVSGNDH